VGCGDGRHARAFAAKGLKVVAIDVVPGLIARARDAADSSNPEFLVADARSDALPGPFDIAVALYDVLGSSAPADDDRAIVRNIASALVPGGYLVLSAMNAAVTIDAVTVAGAPETVTRTQASRCALTSTSWTKVWEVLTFLIAMSAAKAPAKVGDPLAFYEVAATIIPVLFLGLIYQADVLERGPLFFSDDPHPAMTALYNLGPLVFGFVGEVVALHVLAVRVPTHLDAQFVALGIYETGLVLVFHRAILRVEAAEAKQATPSYKRRNLLEVIYILAFAFAILGFPFT
jgi:SAM-dependent methyltransferase